MKTKTMRATLGIALLATSQAFGVNYYWDSNGTSAGIGNTTGTWGAGAAGSAFLSTIGNTQTRGYIDGANATPAIGTTASGDLIYFGTVNLALGSTASTIGIAAGGVSISTVVFGIGQGSQGVTLSGGGGTITLGTAPNIVANNTGVNTIGAVLTGSAGLTMTGPGTLTLTGAETYTGTTTVSGGGTLNIGNGGSGSLGSTPSTFAGALTFSAGGGVFNVAEADASTQGMGALTFSGGEGSVISTAAGASSVATVTFSSLAARTAGAAGNLSLAVNTTSTGGTPNKIVLTGASTGTLLDKGIFFGGNNYAAYDTGGYVRALNYATTGGDVNTVDVDTITASKHVKLATSPASRAGDTLLSLNLAGSGVDYTMSSGTLTVPGIIKGGGGSVSTISGGTVTGGTGIELVIRTDTSSDLLTINSQVTGTGTLTKSGAGTLTLSYNGNTYSGTTTINAGTLAVSGGNAIADASTVALANAPGATFQLTSNETIGNLSGGGFSGGNVNVQGNTLTISASSGTFSGRFIGTGGIVKQGGGTLTLPNPNSFAGTITVSAGTLQFTMGNTATGSTCLVSTGGAINLANGTTLNSSPTVQNNLGQIGNQGSNPYLFAYTIGNAINVTSGTATMTIAGLNDAKWNFTGNVAGSAGGSATLTITTPSGTGRQDILLSGTIADGSGGALGVNVNFNSNTGGSGSYVNLASANTFTGPIAVANTQAAISYLVIGGERGNFGTTQGSGYIGGGNYTNTISLSNSSVTLDYLSSANQTLGGVISGAGAVLKEGTGTLTLTNTNTYSGATSVNSGKLVVTTGSGTRCASAVTIANTAGCILGVQLASAGGQWLSSSTLTVAGTSSEIDIDYSGTVPSTITAPIQVATLTVSAKGTLKVISPDLVVGNTYPLINFTTGPAVAVPYTGLTLSLPGGITGTLKSTGTQLQVVITANTHKSWNSGSANWDTDTPWTQNGVAIGFSASDTVYLEDASGVTGNPILTISGASVSPTAVLMNSTIHDYTITGGAIATGTLTVNAPAHTLTLAGANTYSGATTVSAGTLKLGASGVIPDGTSKGDVSLAGTLDLNTFSEAINGLTGAGIVDTGAGGTPTLTVGGNNVTSSFTGIIKNTAGTLAITKTGGGTLTLSGNSSYSGGTTNSGGTLVASHNNAFGGGSLTINANSGTTNLLIVTDGITLANNITINGGGLVGRGIIENSSTGNATLSGGTITINAGANAGGHFANAGGTSGTLTINSPINSSVIVTFRKGTGIFGGGGSYTSFGIGEGTVKLSAHNGIATNATLSIATVASSSGKFDLASYNQQLIGLTKGSSPATVGNSVSSTTSTLTTTGTSSYAGIIADNFGTGTGKVALTVNGGQLTLSGTNTYTGTTTINAGTLALGATNVFANTSAFSLGSGTLDARTYADTVGSLAVTALSATINVDTGGALAFADSHTSDWTGGMLAITGKFVSGASIRFGDTSDGLSTTQLAQISISGHGRVSIDSNGFLVAFRPTLISFF